VSHEGKVELTAFGGGDIYSADYDNLISQISNQIDSNTKGNLKKGKREFQGNYGITGLNNLFQQQGGQFSAPANPPLGRGGGVIIWLMHSLSSGDLRDWAECNFSTTTPLQKIVSKVALMGAMQKYFDFGMQLMCGLPKVLLSFFVHLHFLSILHSTPYYDILGYSFGYCGRLELYSCSYQQNGRI
jgi:hypothetical protein